jgi:RNA polymerase sigma factor (sigma-70 family)
LISLTDNALMLQVKSGDLDKMALLFQRYHRQLYGFLFYQCGDRQSSEDMVQNVFLRMLVSRHTFTGNGEFRTWIYHLARNVLKDYFSKTKRRAEQYDISAYEETINSGMSPDEALDKKIQLRLLNKAMSGLNAEDREILALSRFHEMKYAEIAEIMDINVGTVKVRVHRVMNHLKEIFSNQEQKI